MFAFSKSLIFSLLLGLSASSFATDKVNLLIMINDSDQDAVSRQHPINQRVKANISQQLKQIAAVYDTTSARLDLMQASHAPITEPQLLEIVRTVNRPPMDVVALLSTHVSDQSTAHNKVASARVVGKLFNAMSGLLLGSVEINTAKSAAVPSGCKQQRCLLQGLEQQLLKSADELGLQLGEKLNEVVNGSTDHASPKSTMLSELVNDYYLVFDGFDSEAVANAEEYLLVFSGYISHRPTEQRHTRTTLLYRSKSGSAMLSRNLHKLLDELNMRATVSFSDNTFKLKRITLRNEKSTRNVAEGW